MPPKMVNNYDWFQRDQFPPFHPRHWEAYQPWIIWWRKILWRKGWKGTVGMSFTEFSYQMIQGYDFHHLYNAKNCKLQMGGSDQWGNIVTGTETGAPGSAVGEAYAFTCPLIKKADGTKFGKSEKREISGWTLRKPVHMSSISSGWMRATVMQRVILRSLLSLMNQQ